MAGYDSLARRQPQIPKLTLRERPTGIYAGATQKNAVKNGWFYGSITQDPYMIGYYAVELAVKAINGEEIDEIVDTGCQFYTAENMDDESIAPLLYD